MTKILQNMGDRLEELVETTKLIHEHTGKDERSAVYCDRLSGQLAKLAIEIDALKSISVRQTQVDDALELAVVD